MTFPLKRMENSPQQIYLIVALLGCVLWLSWGRQPSHPILWIWPAAMFVHWCVLQYRFRKEPDCSLELDDEGLRFWPSQHWTVDRIPFGSIKAVSEEGSSLWIYHYDAEGAEKGMEINRQRFTSKDWKELIRILRERKEAENAVP